MACVLIVEDQADVREMLDLLLRTEGYETELACNGQEALERLRSCGPCLVLLDLMMPVMSGWEFRARQLQDPEIADVPVVCISAVHEPDEVKRRLQLRCLPKPVDFDVLLGIVRETCGA
ncbi:MAG: response regulator [Acidobacteriota bacterium]|nr:response regulator [Acidobacteriota bacterium]